MTGTTPVRPCPFPPPAVPPPLPRMALSGFDNIDICNAHAQPGAGRLEYVPLDEVDVAAFQEAILQDAYNQQDPAGISSWHLLPYVQGSGSYTEDQTQNDQGVYFRNTITAILAADSPAVRGELNRMARRPYLLRLTRGTQVLLIGTPEHPMRFESRFESGADGGDSRVHRLQWTGNTLTKAPGYVPVF